MSTSESDAKRRRYLIKIIRYSRDKDFCARLQQEDKENLLTELSHLDNDQLKLRLKEIETLYDTFFTDETSKEIAKHSRITTSVITSVAGNTLGLDINKYIPNLEHGVNQALSDYYLANPEIKPMADLLFNVVDHISPNLEKDNTNPQVDNCLKLFSLFLQTFGDDASSQK